MSLLIYMSTRNSNFAYSDFYSNHQERAATYEVADEFGPYLMLYFCIEV